MNLLFVEHKNVYGGGQVFLVNLLRLLDRNRYQCLLVASPNPEFKKHLDEIHASYDMIPLGQIKKSADPLVIAANVVWRVLPTVRLVSRMRRWAVDAVCCNDVYSFLSCFMAARLCRIPVVVIAHNSSYPQSYFSRFVFRNAHKIIAVSDNVRCHILSLLPEAGAKIEVIHNGIDCTKKDVAPELSRAYRQQLGLVSEAIVIGTVGRLSPEKGYDTLLKAFSSVRRGCPGARLLILGDGPEKNRLLDLASSLDIRSSCIMPGFRDDIRECLSVIDIFVLSSYTEGLPLSLLEAMHMGKPVVGTRVGGVPEVVDDTVSGLLVEPHDAGALTEKILYLISHPAERSRIGTNARRSIAEKYTIERMVQSYENIFGNLLSTL